MANGTQRAGRYLLSASMIAIAMASPPAWAETLTDALVSAYNSDPTLAADRAKLRALDESVVQARGGFRPRVSLDSTYGRKSEDSSGLGQASREELDPYTLSLSGSQTLYDGGRTANSINTTSRNVDASRASLVSREQDVLLAAITGYLDVLRAQEFVNLANSNVRVIKQELSAARDRFNVGEITRTDVSQAEARLALAKSNLAQRGFDLAQAREAYVRATGAAPGDLEPPPPLPDLPDTLEDAVALGEDVNPAIATARYSELAASSNVKTQIGGLLPNVSLNGDLNYTSEGSERNSETNSAEVSVRASVPLYQGGVAYSRVRAAQAQASAARLQIHDAARRVREKVGVAWASLVAAQEAIKSSREQIRAAGIAFEGVQEEAKVGARTTLDVLDSEQELLDARTNLVSAQRDEYIAAYTLLAAVGHLTVAHLGLGVDEYDPAVYHDSVQDRYIGFDNDETTTWAKPYRP